MMAVYIIGIWSLLAVCSGTFTTTTTSRPRIYTTTSRPDGYCYEMQGVEQQCFRCSVGTYGPYCYTPCGSCKSMYYSFSTNSTSLLIGKFCDSDTGKCIGGCNWPWNGDKCTEQGQCGPTGRDGNGDCRDCSVGYYGNNCASRCSYRCNDLRCEKSQGACYECQSGYYGTTCNSPCENCLKGICDRYLGTCMECEPGFHGLYCNQTCGQCLPDDPQTPDVVSCDRMTAACSNGCKAGFDGVDCFKSDAGQYCYSSRNGPLHCSDCPVGLFGDTCEEQCSTQCSISEYTGRFCEKLSGNCFGCEEGWYGDKCSCKGFCDERGCDEHGYCYTCAVGYYGSYCSQKCRHNCENNGCDRNGDCHSCLPGFYGDNCHETCKAVCRNGRCNKINGFCSACPRGLYGLYCNQTCGQCADVPGQAVDIAACNHFTGNCISGCMNGYQGETCHESRDGEFCYNLTSGTSINCFDCPVGSYGENCERVCPDNCAIIQYLGRVCHKGLGECSQCQTGWYGSKCECRGHCSSEGCDENGICYGCESGYWGPYCATTCSDGCDSEGCNEVSGLCFSCVSNRYGNNCEFQCSKCHHSCDKITGACLDGCAVGFYGHSCEVDCSKCKRLSDVDTSYIPCDLRSGYCKDGCAAGFFGVKCDKTCDCDNRVCDKYTGACRDVCSPGFSGPTCSALTGALKSEKNYTYIGILTGIVLAMTSVILVLVIIIVVISTRRTTPWSSKNADEIIRSQSNEHHYQDLQKPEINSKKSDIPGFGNI